MLKGLHKYISAGRWTARILPACLAALLVFLCAAPCFAEQAVVVKVAVVDYPNFIQMDDGGIVSGYAAEYLDNIAAYTGWRYEFIEMSFADAVDALTEGSVDIVPGNQYTPERAELFDYSQRDMGEGGSVLCVMPDDMRYCYNDYASYDGMRIAALNGSVRVAQTEEKLAEYGVSAEYMMFDTDDECKAALESGEADAVLMSTIRCESKYKILARLSSVPLYFCTNAQRPELKVKLDAAMEEIHLNSPYYEEVLDEKYYGSVPVQLAFTQAEKDYIAASGEIVVAVSDDLTPVEYLDSDSMEYCGIVPDSFRIMEEYSGLSFKFVPRLDKQEIKRQLAAGELDIIASVANMKSIADDWNVTLSDSYFDNSVSMVINDSVSDYTDKNCRIAIRSGYPYLEMLAESEGYKDIVYVDSFGKCVDMVDTREADIALIPSDCVTSIVHGRLYLDVSNYLIPDTYMEYCAGVSRDADPLLISIINKSLASITREQRTEMLVRNLTAVNESMSLESFLAAHRVSILAVALIAAAIIVFIAMYFALSRQRHNHLLRSALAKADAASQAKTQFLARMSHEMRTPMNGILGLSYLMEEKAESPEMKREITQLRESGEYLLQLINDVLDVNRVESGRIKLQPAVCDEEHLFDSVVALVKPQMDEKNISFEFHKVNIKWRYVMLDAQRVKQIFINLLNNAVKFTPRGGRVQLLMEMVSEDDDVVRDRFVVRDNGIGITGEFLPHVFEPFAQESRQTGQKDGTGLGMFITKSLVELMGGSIRVESEVGKGTEFTLYLNFPLAKKPEEPEAQSVGACQSLTGVRVLMCEDHPLNAQIARRLLEKQGAEVVWAENGRIGCDIFARSGKDEFDVVLMDIRMPIMDGLEAARIIRGLDREDAKTVPIIAMTANAYDEDIRKSMDAGMNEHLAKPIVPEALFGAINKHVSAARAKRM